MNADDWAIIVVMGITFISLAIGIRAPFVNFRNSTSRGEKNIYSRSLLLASMFTLMGILLAIITVIVQDAAAPSTNQPTGESIIIEEQVVSSSLGLITFSGRSSAESNENALWLVTTRRESEAVFPETRCPTAGRTFICSFVGPLGLIREVSLVLADEAATADLERYVNGTSQTGLPQLPSGAAPVFTLRLEVGGMG